MSDDVQDSNIEITVDEPAGDKLAELGLEEKDVPSVAAKEEAPAPKGYIEDREEFERLHPGRTWIPKEEYQRNAPLFENISSLKKTVKEQQKQMELLVNHTKQVREASLQAELQRVAYERQEAILQGDVDRVNEADRKLYQVAQQQSAQMEAHNSNPAATPEAQSFLERNKTWFNQSTPENASMAKTALGLDEWVEHNKPHFTNSEKLEFVEAKIKELYPHRFSKVDPVKASKVSGVRRGESSEASTEMRLTPDEFKVYKIYQKLGYTKSEFLKELKKTREV